MKCGKTVEIFITPRSVCVILILFRYAGQVGYLIAGMKEVTEAQIGDTLFMYKQPVEPLPGFKSAKPMVFAGEEKNN